MDYKEICTICKEIIRRPWKQKLWNFKKVKVFFM